ncbi:MAG TPA: winged helix-turn-helix domain-containing protein [Gemmatimonadota bacterium]|nr:winged helix-turn-helix domain-containing protein [Gemmatimonadota bacterium]
MPRETPTLEILHDPARAAVALDPDRARLLAALSERADSAAGLARRLGESRQRLNYHLRMLEQAGLVELEVERRRGNCVERVMRPAAVHWLLDPTVLGPLPEAPMESRDRFSATYLIALAARAIRDLAALTDRARRSKKRLATAAMHTEVRLARPADFPAFAAELAAAVARVVEKHHDDAAPGGRPFRVICGAYPAVTRTARRDEPEEET